MSYEDGLYCLDNVIGYTGDIFEAPTIYFADTPRVSSGADHGLTFAGTNTRYGHITTSHGISANVGREKVQKSTGYEILNKPNGEGQITCHEFDPVTSPNASRGGYAGCFHPSRSMFISKLVMGPNLQAKLMEIAGVILGIYPDKKSVNIRHRVYVDPRMVKSTSRPGDYCAPGFEAAMAKLQ